MAQLQFGCEPNTRSSGKFREFVEGALLARPGVPFRTGSMREIVLDHPPLLCGKASPIAQPRIARRELAAYLLILKRYSARRCSTTRTRVPLLLFVGRRNL